MKYSVVATAGLDLEMPGARHGEMPDAERVMDEALDWLDANALPPRRAALP
ncbi:hypothetical protein WMF18_14525 [Sorangium sp. So ce315]|uniref:hypothetical protein n=1 Tax=Sorangium sp. So ce315 TaxID=3133299 RepID=UPI003F62A1EA